MMQQSICDLGYLPEIRVILSTYSFELDAPVAIWVANNRIESIRRMSAQHQNAP